VRSIRQAYQLNESRACGLVGITRWINRYQSRRDPQNELRQRLRDLAGNRPRYGYRRLTVMLRREGWKVNTKRVYRIYREENLGVRTAKRKKRSAHSPVPLPEATRPNQRWSMDFVSDRIAGGHWFRILTVVDQFTRECLCAYADRSQTGEKVAVQNGTAGSAARCAGVSYHALLGRPLGQSLDGHRRRRQWFDTGMARSRVSRQRTAYPAITSSESTKMTLAPYGSSPIQGWLAGGTAASLLIDLSTPS
jgi:hypothetical protein